MPFVLVPGRDDGTQLTFEYRRGRASSRNAVKSLELAGVPDDVVAEARANLSRSNRRRMTAASASSF